jgi:hypothetical protein
MYAAYLRRGGIAFEYEPKTFILSASRRYKPDFYLIVSDTWKEVKGYCTEADKSKVDEFAKSYNIELLLPNVVEALYGKTYSAFKYWWERGVRPC